MTLKMCTILYDTEEGEPIINRLPVIEEEVVFFTKHRYQSRRNNNNARRSVCYGSANANLDPSDLHEATPLLLQSRLDTLITPPIDSYKRVGKVVWQTWKWLNYIKNNNKHRI